MFRKLYIVMFSFALFVPLNHVLAETNVVTLAGYYDLLVSGNLESAYYLWTPETRERASRFGISYEKIPLKIDCYSPIVKDIAVMRDHLNPPAKNRINLPGGYSMLPYASEVNGKLVEHTYYMKHEGDYFWLTYPQDYYSQNWEVKQTKYFNIRYDSSLENSLNELGLQSADNFIEEMAEKMHFSQDELKLIEDKKIEYFYCETDNRVKEITGHLIKGTYDMPSNDIISAFFPHYHEIVHLLINYKLKKLPLYALPLLREGSAVHFGGRWGKAPNTLATIGEFLITEEIVSLDSIISFSDFTRVATSNIAYSVAGLFSGYLIDKIGVEEYFSLYRDLCGDYDTLLFMSQDVLTQKFVEKVDVKDWDALQTDFRKYLDHVVTNAKMTPGLTKGGKELFNTDGVIIKEDSDFYTFEISSLQNDTVSGNILFDLEEKLAGKRSSVFEEQYKDTKDFVGYRFGVRYDRNEVGVYDYATNHLIAKYIWSLRPSEEYYDDDQHKIYFKFHKDVLPFELNKKTEFNILSN